ncbi:hypothetical protein ONZ43_g4601 [Nemania bipapillata]|uniref:Uncharacterized protein n=1 Tax=Nemania bipapillata TaxID=110536 RepID=A0ACC2IKK8_9PEZI|nr:hypothetical protein ONZ43_g4601 [Nemania bipapillata]
MHEAVLNNEVGIVRQYTPGVEGGDIDGNGEVDSYPRKLYMHRPTSSPAQRLASRDGSVPSAISKVRPMRQEQSLSRLDTDDGSSESESSQSELGTEGSSGVKLMNDVAPVEIFAEQDTPAGKDNSTPVSEAKEETEDFSQSKPGFDFSSPLTVTPPEDSEVTEEVTEEVSPPREKMDAIVNPSEQEENQYTTSPSPSGDENDGAAVESPPSANPEPPSLQHQHSISFGSAGYLGGFHDQRLYGVGLRRVLAGPSTPPSRPLSRLGFREDEQQRPETAT